MKYSFLHQVHTLNNTNFVRENLKNGHSYFCTFEILQLHKINQDETNRLDRLGKYGDTNGEQSFSGWFSIDCIQ